MDLAEFLEALKNTPRTWAVTPNGWIRARQQGTNRLIDSCPLTAVYGQRNGVFYASRHYRQAAKEVGLTDTDRNCIVYAADNDDGRELDLRRRLLAACGLEREEATKGEDSHGREEEN